MPKVKKEHKENRRLQILKAAFQCFSKKGYHGTSMRDIFKATKLSSGAVYNYYSSKEEIVQELVTMGQESTRELIDEVISNSDDKNVIGNIMEYYFRRMDKSDGTSGIRVDVSIWSAALNDKKLMKLTQEAFSRTTKQLSSVIRSKRHNPRKKFDLSPDGLAQVLISLIQGLTIQKMLNPEFNQVSYEKAVTTLLKYLQNK